MIPSELKANGIGVAATWMRRQATKFNGVSYVTQRAAEAALSSDGQKECEALVTYYRENAKTIANALKKCGVYFTGGENSPYVWLKCPKNMASWEFFDYLLKKYQIVGTPGAGFGKEGEGYFRLTGFGDKAATEEAAKRLITAINKA